MENKKPQTPDVENADRAETAQAETPPAETETVEEKIEKLEAEKQVLYDQLLRRQADFENFRKRSEREQQEFRRYCEAALVESLLGVLDAFDRALAVPAGEDSEEYRKGVELIHRQLYDTLSRAGLKPVPATGEPFDPHYHHAVERMETTEHADGTVVEEMQKGYVFKDRLLRPALVKVGVHPAQPADEESVN